MASHVSGGIKMPFKATQDFFWGRYALPSAPPVPACWTFPSPPGPRSSVYFICFPDRLCVGRWLLHSRKTLSTIGRTRLAGGRISRKLPIPEPLQQVSSQDRHLFFRDVRRTLFLHGFPPAQLIMMRRNIPFSGQDPNFANERMSYVNEFWS